MIMEDHYSSHTDPNSASEFSTSPYRTGETTPHRSDMTDVEEGASSRRRNGVATADGSSFSRSRSPTRSDTSSTQCAPSPATPLKAPAQTPKDTELAEVNPDPSDLEKVPQAEASSFLRQQQRREQPQQEGSDQAPSPDEVIWVEFPPGDPENPFNFSKTRKWIITTLAIVFTAEVAATASAYVPGIPSMESDLGYTNHELSLLGIAIYPLGFSLPPLVLAPLSEVFGRNPIYLVCHLCYTILFLGIGFAKNVQTVLILRFLQGAFGSTGSTMVGGTIADIWGSSERGQPMALFATAAIFGTGIGPVWSGFVEQNSRLEWRWIQYIQAIYTAFCLILIVVFLRETRGSIILTRRAQKLRKETGNHNYKAKAELERASIPILIKNSLTRPLIFLIKEPIVTSFSLWISFVWGFMYMLLESIGLVTSLKNYTPGQTGLVFIAIAGAGIIGNLTNPIQEYLYKKYFPTRGPEARLYLACIGATLFPVGCLIYGWTSYARLSIAGPVVGITTLMIGVYHIYLAVFNYLADSYLTYASSALAAQSFARNIFGFAFPLFVEAMYRNLTYPWASTLAAILGAILGIVPFVLFAKGKKIRAKSKISQALQQQQLLQQQQEKKKDHGEP